MHWRFLNACALGKVKHQQWEWNRMNFNLCQTKRNSKERIRRVTLTLSCHQASQMKEASKFNCFMCTKTDNYEVKRFLFVVFITVLSFMLSYCITYWVALLPLKNPCRPTCFFVANESVARTETAVYSSNCTTYTLSRTLFTYTVIIQSTNKVTTVRIWT